MSMNHLKKAYVPFEINPTWLFLELDNFPKSCNFLNKHFYKLTKILDATGSPQLTRLLLHLILLPKFWVYVCASGGILALIGDPQQTQ